MKFYFQSNKKKVSEIGLLFRNFPKYVSLTVGDQKNGFVCSKNTIFQNFPSGRFSSRYAASYLFFINKCMRVHRQRKYVNRVATTFASIAYFRARFICSACWLFDWYNICLAHTIASLGTIGSIFGIPSV